MKQILFINPNIRVERDFIDYPYFVNLGMLQAISILKKHGYRVNTIDAFSQRDSDVIKEGSFVRFGSRMNINRIIEKKEFDTAVIVNSPFLKLFGSRKNPEIVDLLNAIKKKPNTPEIILADCYIGGMHYVDYDERDVIKKYPLIDKICKYECDRTLTAALENNDIQKHERFWNILDELPLPDYEAISMGNYREFLNRVSKKGFSHFLGMNQKTIGLFTSRGCAYNCIFCSSRLYNRTYRAYSLEYLRRHIMHLKEKQDIEKIIILDELPNPNKKRLEDIAGLLNELDMNYEFPNGLRADNISARTLSMMKGRVSQLSVSAESGSSRIVNEVIKKGLDLQSVNKTARLCAKNKIPLAVHFMIGFPDENIEDINKTLELAAELAERYDVTPLIQFATPVPGSELFRELNLSNKQTQDLLDNYMKYFSKPGKFSRIAPDELDLFVKNLKIRIRNRNLEKIIINVTYACNNNCIFCAVGEWRNRKASLKEQLDRLKKASEDGITMVDFDGGEPTLERNIIRLIKYAKNLGFKNISMITNGRLLSVRENAERIGRSGLDSVLISLHGPNASIHEEITRAKGSFYQTLNGIKNILDINEKTGERLEIGVNITLTNKNILYLDEFFGMLDEMGIKRVNVQFITPFGLAKKRQLPKTRDIPKILPDIIKRYSDRIRIQIINLPFCYLKGYEDYLINDVAKSTRSMMFIGRKEQNLSRYLSSKRYKEKECNSCKYNIICGGRWNFG